MQLQKTVKNGVKIYALKEDLRARGLNSNLLEEMTLISMNEMVELCCQYRNIQSWY
tara:strand:+ start:297 stop:464 length:168 start_codon:yes stop_codon:yes gene_type:complete